MSAREVSLPKVKNVGELTLLSTVLGFRRPVILSKPARNAPEYANHSAA